MLQYELFVITLLWQHILYLCTLFLVQGGKWTPVVVRNKIRCHKGTALLQSADEGTAYSYKTVWEHIQKQFERGYYVYQPPHF